MKAVLAILLFFTFSAKAAETPASLDDFAKCKQAIALTVETMAPVHIAKQEVFLDEASLVKTVQNIVAAVILHAQQRAGLAERDPRGDKDDYDLDQYGLQNLRELGCSCRSVKGLENAPNLITHSFVPGPNEKLSFGHIRVWENMIKSLLREEPVRIRNLEADDLRCSDL